MTIKEFGECIEYNIQHNIKHAVLGLGAPGVGKSQLIQQIGKKYGYGSRICLFITFLFGLILSNIRLFL